MTATTAGAQAAPKTNSTLNQAKLYQLILFPFNNGATNVYFVLLMNYTMYHANGVLGLAVAFATSMVTITRAFDAFIDPVVGMLIDRTSTRFGKFRPFMVIGNLTMVVSALIMFFGTRAIPESMMWARYLAYTAIYVLFMVGYSIQTSCTRSGQTCLTNDPKQRPTFTLVNTVASLIGMGVTQVVAIVFGGIYGYGTEAFFNVLIPMCIILSAALTALAVIGIAGKDRPEFYGLGNTESEGKMRLRDYLPILRDNKELQRLIIAASGTKFAFAVATNTAVGCLLYASMMGDYTHLFMPMYVMGYVFSAPFFIGGLMMSQKHGQKKTLVTFTMVALVCYVGVTALLALWNPGNPAFGLSLFSTEGGFHLTLNAYTIAFILLYGVGYGAYYSTADMSIPMVADCSDYETYRTGSYVPGVIGTLFSFADKLVSSLSTTVVGAAVAIVGLKTLPDSSTPYMDGMQVLTIILFCIIPMLAWVATLAAMKGYTLTGERMKQIQAVNACRKDAIASGMSVDDAIAAYQSIDQVPESYLDKR